MLNSNSRSCMENEKMLMKVRELAFTVHELNLYLDSHPNNRMALRYFRKYNDELKKLTALYEEAYGPLTATSDMCGYEWNWIKHPWPWENACDWEGK